MNPSLFARQVQRPLVWCRLFLVGLLLGCLTLHGVPSTQAQEPPSQEPAAPQEARTDSAQDALDALRETLIDEYGYEEVWFERSEAARAVELAMLETREQVVRNEEDITRDEMLMLRGASRVISSQLETARLRRAERQTLISQLAGNVARLVSLRARDIAGRMARDTRRRQLVALRAFLRAERDLSDQLATSREAQERQDEQARLEEEMKRLETVNLKRKAEADLEKIEDRQRLATTQQLKELLGLQADLAKRVIKLTGQRPELEAELTKHNELSQTSFTQIKDELDLFIEQLPSDRSEVTLKPEQQGVADKLFEDVRLRQREARQSFVATRKLEKELADQLAVAEAEKQAQDLKLQEVSLAFEQSQSDLSEERLDLATTRAKLSKLETDLLRLRFEDTVARHTRIDSELSYFFSAKEKLIDLISSEKRSAFYSLTTDQNWWDARLGAQVALIRVVEHAVLRADMFIAVLSNLFSINLWSWVGAFILRLLIVMAIIYLVTRRGAPLLKRLINSLLNRPFFRKYPTVTIKSGEVLRHLLRPTTMFLGWSYMLDFGEQVLPELRFAQWFLNAIYIFHALTLVISIVVLPRNVREPDKVVKREPRNAWHTSSEQEGDSKESVDLFALGVSRSRKLVRSARVITLFWLLVLYVPDLTLEFSGHTVIWRLIDIAATWGFILVIYSVLSTWRDEIARIFDKLAIERLPRAVQFVNQNKDRIWGVLVIAGASLYVIGSESLRLGKRYLIETSWSKQINNFIFRKQIEYKQRDRDKEEGDAQVTLDFKNLPADYRAFFTDRPLAEEVYLVESNAEVMEAVMTHYTSWLEVPTQGSIALHGETGMGRSTLLFGLSQSFAEQCHENGAQLVYARLVERTVDEDEVLALIASLFALKPPASRAELIETLNALPAHVVLIDDCQRLFLRQIGGFTGLETFLQVVNLTDGRHFWVLTFERFAWSYLARIKQRAHYFGQVLELEPWTEPEIQDLIWKRNLMTGLTANFTDLVVTRDNGEEDVSYEVIKSAQGYFRLLHDFSKGNPRVAMLYWLRSLKLNEHDDTVLDVGLFRSPPQKSLLLLQDNYWFTLTAIAQHGALDSQEIACIINAEEGFCEMAINYFQEKHIVDLDANRRARLTPIYMRQIIKQLTISNYLYD